MRSFLNFSVIFIAVMKTSNGGTIYDYAVSHDAGVLKTVNGIEFDNISRGTLLKILATFQESINAGLAQRKLKPVFTAQFANNKYTRPHIYPEVYKRKHQTNN